MATEETKSCCPSESWPALTADYTPKGEIVEWEGASMYAISPSGASDKAVVIVHDVHGPDSGRTKHVADQLAQEGYHVVLPDMYEKQTITAAGGFGTPDGMAWLKTITRTVAQEYLDKALAYLATKGVASGKVGLAGYCWGGWIAMHAAGTGQFAASVGLHPSPKLESMLHGGSEEDLASAVKTPLMYLPAGNDADNVKPGGALITILEGLAPETVCKEYPDMTHGWAIRGDLTDEKVARDVKAAYLDMLGFLNKHIA